RDCALFLPIISEHTEARAEGYFRLEWRLAVDRSQLMADDQPFLLPVAIDRTSEASARVPDAFRTRQWIRLREGTPSADFATQVKRLLGTALPGIGQSRAAPPAAPRTRTKVPLGGIIAILIVLVMLVAVGGYYATKKEAAPSVAEAPVAKASAVVAPASSNSIAVLPFANLSDDKQNEY